MPQPLDTIIIGAGTAGLAALREVRKRIDRLIAEHDTLKHNHNHILWALLNVAIWHDRFFR